MPQLVYKFLPPHFDLPRTEPCDVCQRKCMIESEPDWVPYLKEGNEKVLFSSVENLNDPFECRPMDYSDQIARETNFWNGPEVARGPGSKLPTAVRIRGQLRIMTEWWPAHFILSLAGNCHGSAMWAHYAKSHTGVCIGFDSEHKFFGGSEFRLSRLRPVEYRSATPMYSPDNPERPFYTKAIEWAYEEESRMLCNLSDWRVDKIIDDGVDYVLWPSQPVLNIADYAGKQIPALKPRGALVRVPHNAISEIIVGCRADPRLKEWIKVRAQELEVRAYESQPSHSFFKMEKTLLV
jgi:hypothetical protein